MKQNKYRKFPGMGGGMGRPDRLEQRRADAVARNAAWEALPAKQKLASLKNRPGESAKQVARVLRSMP